jgi:hypothetical protein
MRIRAACVVALFVAMSGGAVVSAATVTNEVHIPFSATIVNSCNGETVTVDGTTHALITTTSDNSGGLQVKVSTIDKGTGVASPSGTQYTFSGENTFQLSSSGKTDRLTATSLMTHVLVSQGGEENLIVRTRFHVAVTPSGNVTASVDSVQTVCVG